MLNVLKRMGSVNKKREELERDTETARFESLVRASSFQVPGKKFL